MSLHSLIVDPDLQSRMRLKQIAMSSCKHVALASTLREGLERLNSDLQCDALYLSTRFDHHHCAEFLHRGKQTKQGSDSAYLLIFNGDSEVDQQTIARMLMVGFDGSITEPCSVEDFSQSITLATQIKKMRQDERILAGIKLTVSGIAQEIDTISMARKAKMPAVKAESKLRELAASLATLPTEFHESYVNYLAEFLDKRKPSLPYSGVSKRVQQRLIRRITQ